MKTCMVVYYLLILVCFFITHKHLYGCISRIHNTYTQSGHEIFENANSVTCNFPLRFALHTTPYTLERPLSYP